MDSYRQFRYFKDGGGIMEIKEHHVILDSGEVSHLVNALGLAIGVYRLENFEEGKTILTDASVKELQRLQEKLESVH